MPRCLHKLASEFDLIEMCGAKMHVS